MVTLIKETWFIWVIALSFIGIGFLGEWWKKRKEKRELQKWLYQEHTLEEWKEVDPLQFEKLTALIFEKLGFRTKLIGGPGDKGIDIIAQKEGQNVFIQCKRMSKVGPNYLREFYGSITDKLKKGDKAVFVTSGLYTLQGKEFARLKNIELVDGLILKEMTDSINKQGN